MHPAGSFVPHPRGSGEALPPAAGVIIATYRDPMSGCTFFVARPAEQPRLWRAYLDGALRSYRKHGVEVALEYEHIVDGRSTALFFLAVDSDNMAVGGMRGQGPYTRTGQAHAVAEWDGREGSAELQEEIAVRLPEGVIEMKGGWVEDTHPRRRELSDALARFPLHAMRLLEVRWALCTVAQHAERRWQMTGGVVSSGVCAVNYPDQRYRTVLMWWDLNTFAGLTVPEQLPRVFDETSQFENVATGGQSNIERISS